MPTATRLRDRPAAEANVATGSRVVRRPPLSRIAAPRSTDHPLTTGRVDPSEQHGVDVEVPAGLGREAPGSGQSLTDVTWHSSSESSSRFSLLNLALFLVGAEGWRLPAEPVEQPSSSSSSRSVVGTFEEIGMPMICSTRAAPGRPASPGHGFLARGRCLERLLVRDGGIRRARRPPGCRSGARALPA